MSSTTDDALMGNIVGRRSVRQMLPRRVARAHLELLVEAACWAPSPHKAQPWRFAIVDDQERQYRMAVKMAAAFRVDLEADGVEPATINRLCEKSIATFRTAPALLAPCLCMDTMRAYADVRRQQAEEHMAIMSAGSALQNLMLRAHGLGLASCWYSAPLFCHEVVARALDLPDTWRPLALVIVGYAATQPPMPPRREFNSLLRFVGEVGEND
jgi:F420 biosynthesis protein FbiB-like protein